MAVLINEQCSIIEISALYRASCKIIREKYPDIQQQEEFRSYLENEFNNFSINGQTFTFTSSGNVFGGIRWYFICEKCHRRVHKLFLPPEAYRNYVHRYRCRKCHDLRNLSVVKGHDKIYVNVIRPLKRLRQIESRLERGYLTSENTARLLNEYDTLEKKMKDCPEYRLYSFKRKRGIKV
jgi:hypothetical protein